MRSNFLRAATVVLLFNAAAVSAVAAQSGRGARGGPVADDAADTRAALGLTVSLSETSRDTLGVLISGVVPGGAADRAGLNDGNRVSEINGVSVRVAAADVGQADAGDAVLRRFARQVRIGRAGDAITLRVFGGGRFRVVTLPMSGDAPAPAPVARRSASAGAPVAPLPAERDEDVRSATPSVAGVLDALGALRAQIHQLAQSDDGSALTDSLASADDELGDLQKRLRAAQATRLRAPAKATRATDADAASLPGLRLTTIAEELVPYFGAGSDRGLLVLEADSTWDPIRTGDVLLRVNGAAATVTRLRDALDRRQSTVDILRRKRALTVTLYGRE